MSDSGSECPPKKRKYRKYINNTAEVYLDIIRNLMNNVTWRILQFGQDDYVMKLLHKRWTQKLGQMKTVDEFIPENSRRCGPLTAKERAASNAKREQQAKIHPILCKSIVLVKSTKPTVRSVIGPNNEIVKVVSESAPTTHGAQCAECNPVNKDFAMPFLCCDIQPEWSYPRIVHELTPEELVLATFTITLRKIPNIVERRELKVRIPAAFVQQKLLNNLVDRSMLVHLASLDITSANAKLLCLVRSTLIRRQFERKRRLQQLDGNFSDSDDESKLDESNENEIDTSSTTSESASVQGALKNQQAKSECSDSSDSSEDSSDSSDSSYDSDSSSAGTDGMISVKSLKSEAVKLKETVVCAKSLSPVATTSDDTPSMCTVKEESKADTDDESWQKIVEDAAQEVASNVDTVDAVSVVTAATSKAYAMQPMYDASEVAEDVAERAAVSVAASRAAASVYDLEEDTSINSDDDLSSDNDESDCENVIICLYDKVFRRRDSWRLDLRSGIMNIRGEDYVFDTLTLRATFR